MHHAALCFDAEFECGGDKALEQGMSAVGAALELGVELCAQMEVTAGRSPPDGRQGWCRK